MRSVSVQLSAVSLLAFATPALAAEAAADSETLAATAAAAGAESITVTGQRAEYGAKSTSTATKTNTEVRNIPQALTVISEKQIEDQAIRSVGDLLTFVPGASPATGEGNRDTFTLRGNSSTADFFADGLRDDVQYFRDFYNVDRVEVLKGPNAMIFGRGGGGGIVNRVIKRPTFGSHREALVSTDNYGSVRFSGDADQLLGNNVAVRLTGMYEDGDSFRRHVDLERYGINPTLAFQAGEATRLDFGYEFFHDRRTADRGVPSKVGEPLEGFDRTFFGDPDQSYAKVDANIARFGAEHEIAPGLTIRNHTIFGDFNKFYQNIFPNGAVLAATSTLPERVKLGAYNNRNDRRNLLSETDLIWESRLGGVDQTLLLGFEVGRQKTRNHRLTGAVSGTGILPDGSVPLSDPTVDTITVFAPLPTDANNRTKASIGALYVQDQIRPTEWLEIVAGLRFDSFKLEVDDLRPAVDRSFSRRDELLSPRFGLVLKPGENLSIYASYSRSYLPQSGDQFSGLDINTSSLKPERFDNYELGAKWEPINGLLATAAIYRLDRTNTRVANPDGSGTFLLSGEQRSRGLELGLERSLSPRWQVSAGYAWQKAEVTEATTACASGDCNVPNVPRHSFSLWNRYDVSKSLGLGLGVVARSKSYASIGNSVTLPGYTRVDAAAYYKLLKGVEAQVNLENIFNVDYFPMTNGDNNIAPGAPRSIRAQLRFGF
ncbi:TonB-dependent receptor [Sphingomonas alba]|uniref:TonB-dependent siderophore receptor n=1 Tax=Sphingomonas alba TaxID=2908208 RepID=A0ABT0RLT5_9SPHN|nr:TonB-dependent siderophore receptor [Sphingomonas alba]MCL6683490.1 TonB-dependent siderophore receptor [Sphingomonas alba]